MSWLFSQALVAAFSAGRCSAGEPSAQLNVMPTPHPFWRNDKTMEFSTPSQFGLTCAVLTADHGEALLTLFLAASHVRTSAQLGRARASTADAPASGVKWHESSVRYDLTTSSWRTHRCLWDEALPWSSVTLPRWGSMRNGLVYQHPTLVRPISETASGLWRTPTAQVSGPKSSVKKLYGRTPKDPQVGLADQVLAVEMGLYPTPCARDYRSPGRSRIQRTGGKNGDPLPHVVGGQLNPMWVEWLMGWPLGWTDLKPLAMDKFREWQQQHSICLVEATHD